VRQAGGRIPSLDGLRALSIFAVLLGHLAGTQGFPRRIGHLVLATRPDIANIGVRVFFVISGFLITSLLITEHHERNDISLKRFYLRRTLRIFPAYGAYLLAVAFMASVHVIEVPAGDFVHALTYTMNYAPHPGWHLGHLWSLALEEQFYLVWPAVVVLATPKRAWRVAVAVVCIVPFVRIAQTLLLPASHSLIGRSFETTADAIALGCLLALRRDDLWARPGYRWAVQSIWFPPLLMICGLLVGQWERPDLRLGYPLVNVAVMLGIDHLIRYPAGRIGRILNSGALVTVGTLSYSLYLWQEPFVNRSAYSAFAAFPQNLVLAFAAAAASYYLVERPFLRLRPRLETRWFGPRVGASRIEQATGL